MPNSLPNPLVSDTYLTIAKRLAAFNPPIVIANHIKSNLVADRNTLNGISFVTNNQNNLLHALRIAKDDRGNQAFAEGSKADPQHWDNQGDPNNWALRKSFSETHGIGFREIWRPRLSTRPLSLDDVRPNQVRSKLISPISANFNDSLEDRTSLHCAIATDICNIHIDQMGFVMIGPDGKEVVDPDFLQHLVNELWFKSKLDRKLPAYLIDRFSIELPNSTNAFSRVGISYDPLQAKNYRVRVTGSCAVLGQVDCSATLSVSGNF